MYALSDYHYDLPGALIAQEAIHPHHDARLIIVDKNSGDTIDESTFWHLDRYIPADRVIFFNNSRVLPARIRLHDTKIIDIDGKIGIIHDGEILFCQKQVDGTFEAMVRPGKKYKIGTKILLGESSLEVVGMSESGRYMRAHGMSIESIMEAYGELPLPPYIEYSREKEEDYQTTFAKDDGSVAAPTASLHFTRELMEKLPHEQSYVTLHVGMGTFKGVDTEDIRDYHIHSEMVRVDADIFAHVREVREGGRSILAVGTTVCRTLESLPYLYQSLPPEILDTLDLDTRDYWDSITGDIPREDYIHSIIYDRAKKLIDFSTQIYIYPGKSFYIVDELITNFHLPESSLLMLVSAFLGYDATMRVYQHAIEEEYRFFSFGDGMYIKNL